MAQKKKIKSKHNGCVTTPGNLVEILILTLIRNKNSASPDGGPCSWVCARLTLPLTLLEFFPQIFFCDLKLHSKFRNHRATPFWRNTHTVLLNGSSLDNCGRLDNCLDKNSRILVFFLLRSCISHITSIAFCL